MLFIRRSRIISRWKRIRHRLELAGVYILAALPAVIPLKLSLKIGGLLGVLAFDLFRIRREVTIKNIGRAFGNRMDYPEKVKTGRRSYINFAKSMVEFASMGRFSEEKLLELVTFSSVEYVDDVLDRGKGAIVVTGHFGSWELLGAATAARKIPVDFLVGEQTNKLVDDYMNRIRNISGLGTIPIGVSMRGIFASLKNNRLVAMLSDQNARKAGVFVDFFGIPASTYPGAAQFAQKLGCPILFCYIRRREDETHEAVFLPPIEVDPLAEKDSEIMRLTRAHVEALEKVVYEYPDQYFWAHRRWKTRPPEETERDKRGRLD